MKKVILSVVAVVFAVSAFAQDAAKVKKTPEEVAQKRADKLKTELTLTDDQRAKAYTILLDNATKVQAIKAKYPNDKKAARTEIKPVKAACDTSIKAILTPEQIIKYDAMKKAHKDKKGAKNGKKHPKE